MSESEGGTGVTLNEEGKPTPVPGTAGKKAPLWEDFIDIFLSPAAVFERRATGQFGAALVVFLVVAVVLAVAFQSALAPILQAGMMEAMTAAREGGAEVSEDQLALARKVGDIAYVAGVPFGLGLTVALVGFSTWLAARIFGVSITLAAAFTISTYAAIPRLLGLLAVGLQTLFFDVSQMKSMFELSTGPARFFSPDTSQGILAAVSRFDPFLVWVTVLLALGVKVIGRTSWGTASAIAFSIWLVAGIASVVPALLSGM